MRKDTLLGCSSGDERRNLAILHKKGKWKATSKVIAERGYVRIILNNYFIRKCARITLRTSCIFLAFGIFNSHCSCLVDVKTILSHTRSGLMNLMILLKKMKVLTVIKITKLKRTRGTFVFGGVSASKKQEEEHKGIMFLVRLICYWINGRYLIPSLGRT